jgi:hypothetical protein
MTRRLLYAGFGILALSFLAVLCLRCAALNAADASSGQKNSDVVARLEGRIAALESRIAKLEKERAGDGFMINNQPSPGVVVPRFVEPPAPLQNLDENWCYTILVDGNAKKAQR